MVVAGPVLGLVGGGAFNVVYNVFNAGRGIYRAKKLIHVPSPDTTELRTRLTDLRNVSLFAQDAEVALRFPVVVPGMLAFTTSSENVELTGDDAIRAAGALLPYLNRGGGSAREVTSAVDYLEQSSDPKVLFRNAARLLQLRNQGPLRWGDNQSPLRALPTASRLALEMVAHEDTERRALEGELHVLEEAWKDAEEIAAIADDLLLPDTVHDDLARLKARDP
jgi:hypothetical protein